jgi:hypothetical protein
VAALDGTQRYELLGLTSPPALFARALLLLLRGGSWGKKDCNLPRCWRTPTPSHSPVTGSVYCASAKVTCRGHSPCLSEPWVSVETRTSQPVSRGWGRPWERPIP